MIEITKDSPKVYQIVSDVSNDILVEWKDFPDAVIKNKDKIKYIRIWNPQTKIFKAIGIKRLVSQFKEHEQYEQVKIILLNLK